MRHDKPFWRAALVACVWPVVLSADELPLSAAQLRTYCLAYQDQPDSAAGQSCSAYVRGFLDGSAAADPRVRVPSDRALESWTERAHRTRLGPNHMHRPSYCLRRSVSVDQVIGELMAYSDDRPPDEHAAASDMLAETLRRFHSCRQLRKLDAQPGSVWKSNS